VKKIPHHPFLIGAFPVLSLWAANVGQVQIVDVAAALLGTSALAWIAVQVASAFEHNRHRATAIASLWLLLFLSYGHIARIAEVVQLGPFVPSRLPFVLTITAVIGVSATLFLRAVRRAEGGLTRTLNVVGAVLVLNACVDIAVSWGTVVAVERTAPGTTIAFDRHGNGPEMTLPDVYYIVLDGYASGDTLRDLYAFDNAGFYAYLRSKGFYVAADSHSNYPMTFLSLASSLNMRYLDEEAQRTRGRPNDRVTFNHLIRNSEVLHTFHEHGYRVVHFSSGWDATDRNPYADVNIACGPLSDYATTLIKSTLVGPLDRFFRLTAYVHPRRVMCELDELANVRDRVRPTFVFAHILAPHPPFVFGPNGEWLPETGTFETSVNLWGNRQKYVDEIRALNHEIRAALENILRHADRPVVVILQGDHGPASLDEWHHPGDRFLRERLSILNAYLVSGDVQNAIYPAITPVNSFRLVFSRYLGLRLPLIRDRSYFADYDQPFTFVDVTERLSPE